VLNDEQLQQQNDQKVDQPEEQMQEQEENLAHFGEEKNEADAGGD